MIRKLSLLAAYALAAALLLSLTPLHAQWLLEHQTPAALEVVQEAADAWCDSDEDCARLCPPDDEDCDGGPQ